MKMKRKLNELRELLKESALTRPVVAEKIGMDKAEFSKKLNGEIPSDDDFYVSVLVALGYDPVSVSFDEMELWRGERHIGKTELSHMMGYNPGSYGNALRSGAKRASAEMSKAFKKLVAERDGETEAKASDDVSREISKDDAQGGDVGGSPYLDFMLWERDVASGDWGDAPLKFAASISGAAEPTLEAVASRPSKDVENATSGWKRLRGVKTGTKLGAGIVVQSVDYATGKIEVKVTETKTYSIDDVVA